MSDSRPYDNEAEELASPDIARTMGVRNSPITMVVEKNGGVKCTALDESAPQENNE